MKKSLIFLFCMILLSSLVLAQNYKLSVSTTQETFEAGSSMNLIILLYDLNNKPIYDSAKVTFEHESTKIEKTIQTNQPSEFDLGENPPAGEWKITAVYQDSIATSSFFIKTDEKLNFEINEDKLVITNIGNTKYARSLEIKIGETSGEKKLEIDIGKSISYRLIAPEGNYDIKILADGKTLFTKTNVALQSKGLTGEAIGVLDEQLGGRSSLTGGISPNENSDDAIINYLKNSALVYVFVLVIFVSVILLAIERRYRKKVNK